jgi:hypothetical protein
MQLQTLPQLLPGADVRIKLRRRLFFVTIKHEGREGAGTHQQLPFATQAAIMSLKAARAPEARDPRISRFS